MSQRAEGVFGAKSRLFGGSSCFFVSFAVFPARIRHFGSDLTSAASGVRLFGSVARIAFCTSDQPSSVRE